MVGTALYALVIVVLYPQFKDRHEPRSTHQERVRQPPHSSGRRDHSRHRADGSTPTSTRTSSRSSCCLSPSGYGASCIAGRDEDGTLSLVTILPVSRRNVVLQKAGALTVQAFLLALATMACILMGRQFDLTFPITHLAGLSIGVALLGVDFGLCAVAIGSITGSRGTALGVTAGLAATSYLVSSLAPVIEWIRPARYASLFYWSVGNQQLANGLSLASLGVLIVVGALLTLTAVAGFRRLDLH